MSTAWTVKDTSMPRNCWISASWRCPVGAYGRTTPERSGCEDASPPPAPPSLDPTFTSTTTCSSPERMSASNSGSRPRMVAVALQPPEAMRSAPARLSRLSSGSAYSLWSSSSGRVWPSYHSSYWASESSRKSAERSTTVPAASWNASICSIETRGASRRTARQPTPGPTARRSAGPSGEGSGASADSLVLLRAAGRLCQFELGVTVEDAKQFPAGESGAADDTRGVRHAVTSRQSRSPLSVRASRRPSRARPRR